MPGGQAPDCATVALPPAPRVAAAPLTVPPVTTFAIGVEAVPATAVPVCTAGRMLALTVTASVVVTAPVVVLSAMPAGQAPDCATVALPPAPRVGAAPLTVPPVTTLAIGVEAVPAEAVPVCTAGRMLALTVTVSVAVAQFRGVFLSHS